MKKFFRFLFYGFNVLMLMWLVSYWTKLGELNTLSEAGRAGAMLGGTIGTGVIVAFWGIGAVILGFLVLVMRGERAAVTGSGRTWTSVAVAAGVGFVGVLAVLGLDRSGDVTRSKPSATTTQPSRAQQPATQRLTSSSGCKVTLANFNRLYSGMGYQNAMRTLGCPGREVSRVEIRGAPVTIMYTWDGSGGLGANMNATFQNDSLVTKAQLGLK
jgi:hypothetical protein